MIYNLKECVSGGKAVYDTALEIREENGRLHFRFVAKNSKYYCPFSEYNEQHYLGDVCEIFIGSRKDRTEYIEFEVSPDNKQFLAKIKYCGVDEENNPVLETEFVENSFVDSVVTKTPDGYIAEISFEKKAILTGDGDVFFNAYRIETDGGVEEAHIFALNPTGRPKFHVPTAFLNLSDYL